MLDTREKKGVHEKNGKRGDYMERNFPNQKTFDLTNSREEE